jgi:penicillin-binding protein 1C
LNRAVTRLRTLFWHRGRLVAGFAVLAPLLVAAGYVALVPPHDPAAYLEEPGTVILDARGNVIERDVARGMRIPVMLNQVAPAVIEATVAAEDQRFWSHRGADPLAMARAAWRMRSERSGASTITQQAVRGTYLAGTEAPLPLRKAREIWLALRLEAHTSKNEVLELYLNHVYYGRGAYGIEAAAQAYFGTSAARLDLAQASFLAGLPQSPSHFDAPEGAEAARARQAYVLERMEATGAIDSEAARAALATTLHVIPPDPPIARHLSAMVQDELATVLPAHARGDGLVIETTIDRALQREAERSVTQRLAALIEHRAGSAAVVVIDPRDGRLLALVGSADYDAPAGQINMALAPRQPGSALKPFLYAAAMERGWTAASMLLDVPSTYSTPSGPYAPVNYDLRFRGPVPLRVALASSLNVPAVRTLDAIGVDALLEMAHRAGMTSLTAAEVYGLALTLGGGEVRPLDLTAAYGGLANGGVQHRPWVIERVRDHTGQILYERRPTAGAPVLSPEIAFLLADILSDRDARIAGFGARSVLDTPFNAAVKTGTSSGFSDNWTVGFTPSRVVGVWVGNPDHAPMVNMSGVAGAAPIWRDVMVAAMERQPRAPFTPPASMVTATVCAPTGLLPGDDCPSPVREWFIAGTEPATTEDYYRRDPSGELRINPPPEARAWAVSAGWPLAAPGGGSAEAVGIVSPRPGSVIYRAGELVRQEVLLHASVPPDTERVDFYVNERLIGSTPGEAPRLAWPIAEGRWELRVAAHLMDGSVVQSSAQYEVRER